MVFWIFNGGVIMPNNKTPSAETVAAMADSIRIFHQDNKDTFSSEEKKIVENLPSKTYIINEMSQAQLDLLYRSIKHLWMTASGENPDLSISNDDAINLDGVYWMLPGGILISGYNHFTAAKNHKAMICSLLDINPIVFEQMLSRQNTSDVIALIVTRGGIRTLIDRQKSEVIMQTNEESWPWVKEKLEKMYHKNKIAKVIDLSVPYIGWESGVTIRIN
jgi:hypothetical protein